MAERENGCLLGGEQPHGKILTDLFKLGGRDEHILFYSVCFILKRKIAQSIGNSIQNVSISDLMPFWSLRPG